MRESYVLNINLYLAYFSIAVFIAIDLIQGQNIKYRLISTFLTYVITCALYKVKFIGAGDIPLLLIVAYLFTNNAVIIISISMVMFVLFYLPKICKHLFLIIKQSLKATNRIKKRLSYRRFRSILYYIGCFTRYIFSYSIRYAESYSNPYVPPFFIATLLFVLFSRNIESFLLGALI